MIEFEAQVVFGQQPEIRLHGELDVATAPKVADAVDYAIGAGCPDLVIDLRGVTFCDSSGLASLLEARRRAGTLILRAPSPPVQRTLTSAGLDQIFHFDAG